MVKSRTFLSLVFIVLCLIMAAIAIRLPAAAQTPGRYFPETHHTVQGRFLAYWQQHGGLAQQGYPLSEEFPEVSPTDGKTYTVQYFERAVFEYHPEYTGTPYEVLLSLLGVTAYQQRYGAAGAPNQQPNQEPGTRLFTETGKRLGGSFRAYWESHGGLAQQGLPLSDEFTEQSALDGKPHTVQYFERAVFEYHPENKGTPYEVLLSQLGTYRYGGRDSDLVLPEPETGGAQGLPVGSDRYLVWGEQGPGWAASRTLLRGFDLVTHQALNVTTTLGDVQARGISGSVVVWQDRGLGCPGTCGISDVRAKDLATGQTYGVATGPNLQTDPAIAGRTVVWLEAGGSGVQVLAKDLDQPNPTPLAMIPPSSPIYTGFAPPLISEGFIVWAWLGKPEGSSFTRAITIDAYNRQTHMLATIARYRTSEDTARYDLDGDRLVWIDNGVQLADLRTGDRRLLYNGDALYGGGPQLISNVRIHGNVVYWWNEPGLYGLRLDQPGVVTLLPAQVLVYSATVAGDWLVWSSNEGGLLGPLHVARLTDLFNPNKPSTAGTPTFTSETPLPVQPTPSLIVPPTASPGP